TVAMRHHSTASDRLYECLDVPVPEGERLILPWIILVPRHVSGHHHVRIADLLERAHDVGHVHVAFVREHFLEVVAMAADVAEVDVKDLPPRPEVADHHLHPRHRIPRHAGG